MLIQFRKQNHFCFNLWMHKSTEYISILYIYCSYVLSLINVHFSHLSSSDPTILFFSPFSQLATQHTHCFLNQCLFKCSTYYILWYLFLMLFYRSKLWKKAEADRNPSGFDQVKLKKEN